MTGSAQLQQHAEECLHHGSEQKYKKHVLIYKVGQKPTNGGKGEGEHNLLLTLVYYESKSYVTQCIVFRKHSQFEITYKTYIECFVRIIIDHSIIICDVHSLVSGL